MLSQMKIFETNRLIIRLISEADSNNYFDMMGNSNVMDLVPRKIMTREESDKHLNNFIDKYDTQLSQNVWAIEEKENNEFIGLCGLLKNSENEDELGYRLREKFWNKGYGTEVTKSLISFGFNDLQMEKIIADVDLKNLNSIKILDKFMSIKKEFFNEADNCMDRRYEVLKIDWTH